MTGSLGLGRRRPRHLALVPWTHQFGLGALGQDAGRTMADELYHGGWPPTPIEIPMGWISGRATFRQDPPFARAEVSQRSGDTARARNVTSVINGREWVFTATLDSIVDSDPGNLAAWVTAYYTDPLPRASAVTLILNSRTPTEIWRILRVVQGSRITITGAPGADAQLVANPWFESGTSGWTPTGGTVAQSTTWSRSGSNSLRLTPDGVSSNVRVEDDLRAVVPGADYVVDGWLFSPLGWPSAGIAVNWFDAGSAYVDTSSASVVLAASVATRRLNVFTAPATAAFASVHPVLNGTPAVTDLLYADEVTMTGPDGTRPAWPDGATDLVVECVSHQVAADLRTVVWALAPIVGEDIGAAGPWFYSDSSFTSGTDVVPF